LSSAFIFATNQSVDREVEVRFCALLTEAVDLWKRGDFQASLDLLAEAEPMIEMVSDDRRGRFHNTRAMALQDLGQHDPAVIEFSGAAAHFEACGNVELQAIAMNNAARSFSLLGNHVLAHESVDKALTLFTDTGNLGQSHDQKARIFLDEGNAEAAEIESRVAVELLQQVDQPNVLAEALTTHGIALVLCENKTAARLEFERLSLVYDKRIMLEDTPDLVDSPRQPSSPGKASRTMPLALTLERSEELIHTLTVNDDAQHALELFELIAGLSMPDEPIADRAMRRLIVLTAEFENFYQAQVARFRPQQIDEPQTDSEN
jgi:tetratricopeptide (TPR) repeat protein